ncbi:mCG1039124, isoform CRA_a [Mus musculus]|nr:mCG1039124, isoform CRA_a [Mus musculus]EDL21735.1 mCG1039124, isoform CRA_a [Mus musculus]
MEDCPPPRTCRSLIGCSPSTELSSRGRQSTWSGELPRHMRRLFVYYLEHRMSAPSCNGECEGGSSQHPFNPSTEGRGRWISESEDSLV